MESPNLIATAGPFKGTAFTLSPAEFSIGRDASNTLVIEDPSLSREHCRIETATNRLVDLRSRNGTYVNGKAVEEWFLNHGDEIRIGISTFLFMAARAQPALNVATHDPEPTRTDIIPAVPLYLQPGEVEYPAASRMGRDLRALLRLSAAVQEARSPAELEESLLKLLLEGVPAVRAGLIHGETSGEALQRDGSRTVIEADTQALRHVREKKSAVRLIGTGTTILAPLMLRERTPAVLYVEGPAFDDGHLQFLIAVGAMAGLAYDRAREVAALESENTELRNELAANHDMVGDSAPMREVYRAISRVAQTDATVLVTGESGTGKELVARAIHRGSKRAGGPFVALNCAALTETLLESELFGHEKGAFTGAVAQKKGKFELANGGTLFLDEVGEMAPTIQAKLLRALQQQEFDRVGGTKPIQVDLRLVAATNRNLEEAVKAGTFRRDLFFRLNVIRVSMPPLRARRDDIAALAEHLAGRICQKLGRAPVKFSAAALDCLLRYDWPGNVRELENAVERAVVFCVGNTIAPADLPDQISEAAGESSGTGSYHAAMAAAKRNVIRQALEQSGGKVTEAARILGIHAVHLHRLVRTLNLRGSGED